MPGLTLAYRFKGRLRRRHAEERHVAVDSARVDVARDRGVLEQRGEFRAEDEIAVRLVRIQKRLFANAVACDKKTLVPRIPDRECEHPAKMQKRLGTIFVI